MAEKEETAFPVVEYKEGRGKADETASRDEGQICAQGAVSGG